MSALVSIIVPVYNLEDYIANCLNSLVSQTYENIEVLCIDDGSSDGSPSIIKAFAEKDTRVKYIRQDNGGVSVARNTGLEKAEGDYILFTDGDDYLHPQAVEILTSCLEKNGMDMVYGGAKVIGNYDEETETINEYSFKESSAFEMFDYRYGLSLGRQVWCKLYRREMLCGKHFDKKFKFGEDSIFVISTLSDRDFRIGFADEQLYYYYVREGSACNSGDFRGIDELNVYREMVKISEKRKKSDVFDVSVKMLIGAAIMKRTTLYGSISSKELDRILKDIWKKYGTDFLSGGYDLKTKIFYVISVYSRKVYEFIRLKQDPTMSELYESRGKKIK